ncbi:MAG: GAP family protein [Bacteroidota bacterium]
MFEVFLSIIPLSLAASVSPTSYLLFFNILVAKQHQLRNGMAFIIGGTLTYTSIAFVVLISIGNVTSDNPHNELHAVADFSLAAISLVLLFVMLREENKTEQKNEGKKSSGIFPHVFSGAMIKLVSANTLPPFIAAIKDVSVAHLSIVAIASLFTSVILITMLPLIAPYLLFLLNKQRALVLLAPVDHFLGKYKNYINTIILILVALYLIYLGFSRLYMK